MSITASCRLEGQEFPCSGNLLPGTKAVIRCHTGYVEPKRHLNPTLTCMENGNWSHKAFQCEAECGVIKTNTIPLVNGGQLEFNSHYT